MAADRTSTKISIFSKDELELRLLYTFLPMNGFNGPYGLLAFFITIIQSFSIAFSILDAYDWSFGYGIWIRDLTSILLLQVTWYKSSDVLYAFWALLVIFLISATFSTSLKRTSISEWAGLFCWLANVILVFFTTISYLPLSALLGSHTSCAELNKGDSLTFKFSQNCWTDSFAIIPLFSVFSFVILVSLSMIKNLFLNEMCYYDNLHLSRSHGFIEFGKDAFIGSLVFLQSALIGQYENHSTSKWSLVAISLAGSLILAYLYTWYNPFYSTVTQIVTVSMYSLLAWSCVGQLFFNIVNPHGFEAAVFIYFGGVVTLLASLSGYFNRKKAILEISTDRMSNSFEVEAKARALLIQKGTFWSSSAQHLNTKSPMPEHKETYDEIDKMFTSGLKKFSNPPILIIFYANFLFNISNFSFSYTNLSKFKKRFEESIVYKFYAFKIKQAVEKIYFSQARTAEVNKYFQFTKLNAENDALQKKFLAKKLSVLSELRKLDASTVKIQQAGCEMVDTMEIILRNYQIMVSINPRGKVFRKYASFISNLVQYSSMTKDIVALADAIELEESYVDPKTIGIEKLQSLFDDKNAVFVLSGNDSNIGEILEVNLGAVDMFCYTVSTELIGLNIYSFMSSPFSENHSSFLRKFLSTGISSVLDNSRFVPAKDKNGFLFQVQLYVRQTIDDGEIKFLGVMRKVEDQPDFIVIDASNMIVSISQKIPELFGMEQFVKSEDLMSRIKNINIEALLPVWKESKDEFYKEQGCRLEKNSRQLHMKATYIINNYSILEIWSSQKSTSIVIDHEIKLDSLEYSFAEESPMVSPEFEKPEFLFPSQIRSTSARGSFEDNEEGREPISPRSTIAREPPEKASSLDKSKAKEEDYHGYQDAEFLNMINDYKDEADEKLKALDSSYLKMIFQVLILGFVISLIAANSAAISQFQFFEDIITAYGNLGSLSFQLRRAISLSRGLQFSDINECSFDKGNQLCLLVKNVSFNSMDPDASLFMLKESSYLARSRFERTIKHFLSSYSRDYYFNELKKALKIQNMEEFHYQTLVEETVCHDIVALNHMLISSNYLTLIDYSDVFQPLVSDDGDIPALEGFDSSNWTPVLPNSTMGFYNNSFTFTRRAQYFLLFNLDLDAPILAEILNVMNDSYLYYISQFFNLIVLITTVPIIILIAAISAFILPKLRILFYWEAEILKFFFKIPKPFVFNMHRKLLSKIEEDPDDKSSAELYFLLQQEGDPNSIKSQKKSKNLKAIMKIGNDNIKFRLKTAMTAITQKNVTLKITTVTAFLIVIPLLYLSAYSLLSGSGKALGQVNFILSIINDMNTAHYFLREAAIHLYSGDEYQVSPYYLNRTETLYNAISQDYMDLVFGKEDIPGLVTNTEFANILYGNACDIVPKEYMHPISFFTSGGGISVTESCTTFDQGLLVNGLNSALAEYKKELFVLINAMKNDSTEIPVDQAAERIDHLNLLGNQIANVLLVSRNLFVVPMQIASFTFYHILQPIQLLLAIMGTMIVYYYVYVPTIQKIENEVKKMDFAFRVLGAIIEPRKRKPSSKAQGAVQATREMKEDRMESDVEEEMKKKATQQRRPSFVGFHEVNMTHIIPAVEDSQSNSKEGSIADEEIQQSSVPK